MKNNQAPKSKNKKNQNKVEVVVVTKKVKQEAILNPSTLKSRNRYADLDMVAALILPPTGGRVTFSKVGTAFRSALLEASQEPEKLPDNEKRRIIKGVLEGMIREVEESLPLPNAY